MDIFLVHLNSTLAIPLYINAPNDWKDLSRFQKRQATATFSKQNTTIIKKELVAAPISPWWFFALLVLSAGMLWLLAKL